MNHICNASINVPAIAAGLNGARTEALRYHLLGSGELEPSFIKKFLDNHMSDLNLLRKMDNKPSKMKAWTMSGSGVYKVTYTHPDLHGYLVKMPKESSFSFLTMPNTLKERKKTLKLGYTIWIARTSEPKPQVLYY